MVSQPAFQQLIMKILSTFYLVILIFVTDYVFHLQQTTYPCLLKSFSNLILFPSQFLYYKMFKCLMVNENDIIICDIIQYIPIQNLV